MKYVLRIWRFSGMIACPACGGFIHSSTHHNVMNSHPMSQPSRQAWLVTTASTTTRIQQKQGEEDDLLTTPGSLPINAADSEPNEPVQSQQQVAPPVVSTQDMMVAMNTNPRRITFSLLSGLGIALAGNLFGVTSQLLSVIDEDTVAKTGLDIYFPRGNYKRVRTVDYTFVIPKQWVADTAVELAKAQARAQSLDYGMPRRRMNGPIPDVAFGPPGRLDSRGVSAGDTNVSVIKSRAVWPPGFSLAGSMTSDPTQGAAFLLKAMAPSNSGREATLINVSFLNSQDDDDDDDKSVAYRLDYRVNRGENKKVLRSVSILAETTDNNLFTFTLQAPEDEWVAERMEEELRKTADSFTLRR